MYIEIKGVQFVNKGDELMFHASLQKMAVKYPHAKFVASPKRNSPYEKRARFGLYQKLSLVMFGVDWGVLLGWLIPPVLRTAYGLVVEKEIDVVLDISGFAYTDKWNVIIAKTACRQFRRMKKNGAKIVLLPQAFGPFNSSRRTYRNSLAGIVENSEIVFARDPVSHEYIKDLIGNDQKILTAPDFTNLVNGFIPEYFKGKQKRICIIPNCRMLDKTDEKTAGKYIPFVSDCIRELLRLGEKPFLLIHEGDADFKLAEKIVQKCDVDIEIVRENDALAVKGIISACKGMIGSRFHGLVNALSQGVPALAIGWTHKYEMLFNEYEFPDGILSLDTEQKYLFNKLESVFIENNARISENLLLKSAALKEQTENMWEKVFIEIDRRGTSRIR